VPRDIHLISLLFDRLTADQQHSVRQAIEVFLGPSLPASTYVGVFVLDAGLRILQPYTNNSALVRGATDRATQGLYSQYVHDSEHDLIQLEELYLKRDVLMHLSPTDRITFEMLRDEIRYSRYQQGQRQLDGLLSLVRYQHLLPGRKTVLYFSQGMAVPQAIGERLSTLIGTANQNNVSFYTLDVRGLRGTPTAASGNKLAAALEAGGLARDEWQPESLQSENNATQMRLAELSAGTGGFLVGNTNDFAGPLSRILDQVYTYYELSYSPSEAGYDGRFHKLSVRVLRPRVTVQSRTGYFAVPDLGGTHLLPFESALLGILNSRPLPRALSLRSAVIPYPLSSRVARCVLALSVPTKEFHMFSGTAPGLKSLHAAFLGLVRDSSENVVRVVGRDLPVEVPAAKLEGIMHGDITDLEQFDLEPGHYTVEVVAQDMRSMASTAKRTAVFIPRSEGLRLSGITRVRKVESPGSEIDSTDPLDSSAGRVTPELSDVIEPNGGTEARYYFVVYPDPDSAAQPDVRIELLRDGTVVRSVPATAIQAHAPRGVPYLVSIPIDRLEPGSYVISASASQGEQRSSQKCHVEVR
jgi:VWFA-related protein